MRLIKIGLANVNSMVGAFKSNTDKLIEFARQMNEENVTIGCFPEMAIPGYPAEDLVQWKHFLRGQWEKLDFLRSISETSEWASVFVVGLTVANEGIPYNCAALICEGEILGIVPKEKLPTYGIFYEGRTHSKGIPGLSLYKFIPFGDFIFKFPFGTVAIEVCEDIWSSDGPMRRRAYSDAELIINISASPWRAGVVNTRREMISTRAADNQATVVYTNLVGGNDSLIFDGGGYINQNGQMILEASRWQRKGLLTTEVVDLDKTSRKRRECTTWREDQDRYLENNEPVPVINCGIGPDSDETGNKYPVPSNKSFFLPSAKIHKSPREEYFEDLIEAMKMGLADYFEKTGAFKCIGISLSGGKDSSLTTIIAWLYAKERFGHLNKNKREQGIKDFIRCFSQPSQFNSDETKSVARLMCEELGVGFKEVSINEAFESEKKVTLNILDEGEELNSRTLQNIQARIRGMRMWNWANQSKGMWLQTGNMSEKAVGYTTVGGDLMGAYSLIANLPKTVIIELLRYLGEKHNLKSVEDLLKLKASAELEEEQEDERDLMPFPVLDACFALFAGEKLSPIELYKALRDMWTDEELEEMRPDYEPGMLKVWTKKFLNLFVISIFKWVQAPMSVHLGSLDLDRERALQLPVVQSREWLNLEEIDNLLD